MGRKPGRPVGLYKSTGRPRQFYLPKKQLKIAVRDARFAAILTLCRGIYRHSPTVGTALIVEPGAVSIVRVERFTSACEAEEWEYFWAYLMVGGNGRSKLPRHPSATTPAPTGYIRWVKTGNAEEVFQDVLDREASSDMTSRVVPVEAEK